MKLYAVYGPDGKRLSDAMPTTATAWGSAAIRGHIRMDDNVRRLKRAGYTCEPVEIVRKGERDGKAT